MKKNLIKGISVSAIALMMAVSMAGCSSKKEETPTPTDVTTPVEGEDAKKEDATPAKEMTEEEYVAEVNRIYTDIQTASLEGQNAMAGIDATDAKALVKVTTDMVEKVKPLYVELGAITAPAAFTDAQAKIASGVDASVKMLDISLEMMDLGMNADQQNPDAETMKKVEELQAQALELQTQAQDLATGITEVLTPAAPATDAPATDAPAAE